VLRSVQAIRRELPEPACPPPRCRTGLACARGGVFAAVLLLLSACEKPPAPGFLQTLHRNCDQGSAEACSMLNTVDPDEETDISPPVHAREIVQAILAGMQQGKQHADSSRGSVVEDPKDGQ
jgi:hypothetical protein